MTTLYTFCKDHGLAKTSVKRWLNSYGFDTSEGLSDEAQTAALKEFKPAYLAQLEEQAAAEVEPAEAPAIRPQVIPDSFFQTSALAPVETREIQLPEGFDPTAMVRFFDGVVGEATDTGSLLAIADMALNAVEGAMDAKLNQQRQTLTKAQQDAEKLAEKLAETKTNLKVKALESRILAEQQTSATKTAEQRFAELMSMGKPCSQDS